METFRQIEKRENKPMGIGYRLKLLRKTLNMKPEDFALSVGTTPLTLSKWEKNETVPRNNFIQMIVKIYNVNKKWIEWGIGDMFAENIEEETEEKQTNVDNVDKSETQSEDFKNTRPYEFAMEHGCGDAASSFFAAFCNMNDKQKEIVVNSFRAVVNVFQEARNSDAEIELDKNSIMISEPQDSSENRQQDVSLDAQEKKAADSEEKLDSVETTVKNESSQINEEKLSDEKPKKRQEPWKGRILAARAKTNSLKIK